MLYVGSSDACRSANTSLTHWVEFVDGTKRKCMLKSTRVWPCESSHAVTPTVTGDVACVHGLSHSPSPYEDFVGEHNEWAGKLRELPSPR
jgi:hypothetical protein